LFVPGDASRQIWRNHVQQNARQAAFAKCAAIREPMVPAPSTTAFSMRRFMARLFYRIYGVLIVRGTGYKTGHARVKRQADPRDRLNNQMAEEGKFWASRWCGTAKDSFALRVRRAKRIEGTSRVGLLLRAALRAALRTLESCRFAEAVSPSIASQAQAWAP